MKQILVVDDTPSNLALIRGILEEDYKANYVTSGEQALRFLDRKEADLIILDILMPEMDGIETYKRMKERTGFCGKVIFLTAVEVEEAKAKYSEIKLESIITKPFHSDELRTLIEKLFEEGNKV